jgi:hypothetical protein
MERARIGTEMHRNCTVIAPKFSCARGAFLAERLAIFHITPI